MNDASLIGQTGEVGILDDHNPYPGLKSVRPLTGDQTREGKVWAVIGLLLALLWLGGLASIAAIVCGLLSRAQLRESGRASGFARIAVLDMILGAIGIVVSVWWFVA